jgi:hypothetical protein
MATNVNGSSRVVLTEHALMNDALNKCVLPGMPVRVDVLVQALRISKTYGAYFQKVNRYGLSRSLSRWLRTGAFPNHVLVSGVGIRHVSDQYLTTDGEAAFRPMTLSFNVPKKTAERTL